ncbi:SRPBCC domain-containing protein [Reyranella sp.]|uniref:SRPBCC domain-containing protein n=1 Tax=Reyranella sp. TaxID=1929291 RepID=UPI0011FDFDA7|nr:SRPBCC domain-containing protein [Reyranella sp.]TAJ86693.1 MAG: polyketide cyclase [Reyranella sp.]
MTAATSPTRSVEYGTIRLERVYKAAPVRVFAAWAEPAARAKWDVPGRWIIAEQTFDFREGGREVKCFGPAGDPRFVAETRYVDIVPEQRIVYAYGMTSRGEGISVSLTTVEFSPSAGGTRLVLTEQVTFLDCRDNAINREEGLASMLDKIGLSL